MSVWVRRFVTVACLLAAWLVVRPASASAPMCDQRGASILAPLPTFDAPDASVDIGDRGDACDLSVDTDRAYQRGEKPASDPAAMHVDVTVTATRSHVPACGGEAVLAPDPRATPQAGVRFLVERPPRAV
jgi:hypothetical protein